jgi:hypothetical protein
VECGKLFMKRLLPGLVYLIRWARAKGMWPRYWSMERTFTDAYHGNWWGSLESVSGSGSTLVQTRGIRAELPALISEIGARSFLDIPCGDFNWMKEVELDVDTYIGADIVTELVESNDKEFGSRTRRFVELNIVSSTLPKVDVVFCRDCLPHFAFDHILRAIDNVRRSNSMYLLTTTFPHLEVNTDINTGGWRPLNLTRAPFCFPDSIRIISEQCTEAGFSDKALGLWKIADI